MAKAKSKKDKSGQEESELSELCFLVVDDDIEARKTICDGLRLYGVKNIIECANTVEALQAVDKSRIDFIISDWQMPGLSGLDLLRMLKSEQKLKNIPFIMITSPVSDEENKIEKAADASVDAYVIKPFRPKVLNEKIKRILEEKKFKNQAGVLIVDDNEEVRHTVSEYFKQMGHSPIFEAPDGEQAVKLINENLDQITLVVSDWEMPNMAGIELLKTIRANEKLRHLPFIMITSQTSSERMKIQKAMEEDVDNYLLKPFRSSDLKKKVSFVLKKSKARFELQKQLDMALNFTKENRYPDAEKIYIQILSKDSKNLKAILGLAAIQVYLAPQKGHDMELQYIRTAIRLYPKSVEAHLALALAFENAMSLEKAIASLRESLNTCLHEEIYFHLGRLLHRRKRDTEAIEELEKATQLNPDYTEALELLEDLKNQLRTPSKSGG